MPVTSITAAATCSQRSDRARRLLRRSITWKQTRRLGYLATAAVLHGIMIRIPSNSGVSMPRPALPPVSIDGCLRRSRPPSSGPAVADDETARAIAALLDAKLSKKQQTLLSAILWPVIKEGRADDALWPTWQYVNQRLGRDGIAAAQQVVDSLPSLQGPQRSYGLVWRDMPGAGHPIRPDEKVGLTLAGVHHADPHSDHERANRLAQLIALLAHDEAQLPLDPTGVVTETIQLADLADPYLKTSPRAGATSITLRAAVHLLGREPIPIMVNFEQFTAVIGDGHLLPFRDVTTAQDYLAALIRHADLQEPAAPGGSGYGPTDNASDDETTHETTRRNPSMYEWPAWSQDAREVTDARVLAGLLTGLGEDGQTTTSTAQLVGELGLTDVEPNHLAAHLVRLGYFTEDSLSLQPGSNTLTVTSKGRRLTREIGDSRQRVSVNRSARSALLRWLYESGGDRRPNPDEILTTPFSWFYGTQFTSDQVADAARNLRDRGFIEALGTSHNDVLRVNLTPRGEACVESFDANPDALERPDTGSKQRIEHAVTSPSGSTPATDQPLAIFLVHGRDNEFKWEVKNFIERIVDRTRVEVVILHEQVNQGQTLLKKFEQHAATASYAVVLLTPDDVGGPVGEAQESRARQNVIFELGFFCGRLGRKHVAAINKGVEKPSDIDGFAYIAHAGQWTEELRRELEAAGLTSRP